jgi:hypothetical protein
LPLRYLSFSFMAVPERMMITLSRGIDSILEAFPDVRIMVVRPNLRTEPPHFKQDLISIQVSFRRVGKAEAVATLLYSFKPFLQALDKNELKIRVLPHFPLEPAMLGTDGSSLNDEASAAFMTFLATQISDLIAYFASRNLRSTGMVDLTGVDENSNEHPIGASTQQIATGHIPHPGALAPLKTPTTVPRLDMSSGSDSHMFEPWVFPETYSTPVMDPPARPPVSGVKFWKI